MNISSKYFSFSLDDTQAFKGIALVLLLCHHCLFEGKGYDDIFFKERLIFKEFGMFCKVCVSIFVFLSGYGLTASAMKASGLGNIFHFYRRRFAKLMINYWFVYLLFVPLGVLFFNRTFPIVYGEDYAVRALADILGLHAAVTGSSCGYNPTWWFYSCIIMLYLIFPLIWKLRNYWYLLIPFSFVFPSISIHIPLMRNSGCDIYMPVFVCGMSLAYIKPQFGVWNRMLSFLFAVIFLFTCLLRMVVSNPIYWDIIITIYLVFLYKVLNKPAIVLKLLVFLGKHSCNVFLFHTFMFYYFHDMIYWSSNPILICLTMLIVCLPISIGIEWLKTVLAVDKIQEKLAGLNNS